MGKKKQFIDKKNAITFKLTPAGPGEQQDDHDFDPYNPYGPPPTADRVQVAREAGITFRNMNDYDYAQHLRQVEDTTMQLTPLDMRAVDVQRAHESSSSGPSGKPLPDADIDMAEVFAAQLTLPVGDDDLGAIDADVLAALNSDYECSDDDEFDDDFLVRANEGAAPDAHFTVARSSNLIEEVEDDEESDCDSAGDLCLECGNGECYGRCVDVLADDDDELPPTLARPNVSMQRRRVDETDEAHLRKILSEYTEEDMADAAMAEETHVQGFMEPDDEQLLKLMDGYVDTRSQMRANTDLAFAGASTTIDVFKKPRAVPTTPNNTIAADDAHSSSEEEDEELVDLDDGDGGRDKWDSETILTTASTLYNHPTLISEPVSTSSRAANKRRRIIELDRHGMPAVDARAKGLTAKRLKRLGLEEDDGASMTSVGTASTATSCRPKNETPEERRARKAIVRAERKERRQEKKANTMAFKEEHHRQKQQQMTNIQTNKSVMHL